MSSYMTMNMLYSEKYFDVCLQNQMMRMLGLGYSGSPKPVRIVVVGEKGTGKTSLIIAALNESSQPQPNIPPVLPYTTFPSEWFRDPIPATIIDTSSK